MLTLFRSNRAELLAQVLATELQLEPPPPLEQVQVIVNTWPTSRWLGEQIALGNGAGIAANLRFPFPSTLLRQLVDQLAQDPDHNRRESGADPWRAQNLVWPLLELLPALLQEPEAAPLLHWLERRQTNIALQHLDPALWQLGRAIADAFDDYGLYRPAMVTAWLAGHHVDAAGLPLSSPLAWQPLLLQRLAAELKVRPFGLRALGLIRRLQDGWIPPLLNNQPLRLFGLSSLAPVQVELLQALSGSWDVELYLITPCRDLWQRREAVPNGLPLGADWLLEVPGLEARFGRLGAEFQQLLEGSGDTQLGQWREGDLFFAPASTAKNAGFSPTLLEQLQERLANGQLEGDAHGAELSWSDGDRSLEFHACPGRLRQLQVMRDQILQLLAADSSLEPRDILVMTPQVEAFAPLVGAVFGDADATGVHLPWRLTDRSQQSEAGITQGLMQFLQLGGERLTASGLDTLLGCGPLLSAHQLESSEAGEITQALQQAGFRWGLDAADRGGDPSHSLSWAIDRLVLGLVLPEIPGLAPAGTAPMALRGTLEQQGRWLTLLRQMLRSLRWLGSAHPVSTWVEGLRQQLSDLFGDGGTWAWELQTIHAALSDWQAIAANDTLQLPAPVVAEVLSERLSEGSGRFGHRSGCLTISALEPMRAIPHRVVVLMGLDAEVFPRQRQRPGFHLMEQQRLIGDPSSGDQDRYVLLEALLSARQHLLVSWSCRDERTGEHLEASTPVRQWLELLEQQLKQMPLREHAANALERSNFLSEGTRQPSSCDQRLLRVRQHLEKGNPHLAAGLAASPLPRAAQDQPPPDPWADLLQWLKAPQQRWLEQLGIRPKESAVPVLDLEALELDERQRASLLRRELEGIATTAPGSSPDWLQLERGRGLLPPLSAGTLEAGQLQQRWISLHRCLERLGEAQALPVQWGELRAELQRRSDQIVLVHTAKPRTPQRQQLWLELLLAAAAEQKPLRGVLIGRDGNRFRVLERVASPSASEAAELLEQLLAWRRDHRQRCWPLPPETGWAMATGDSNGKGLGDAPKIWEGDYLRKGEREDPVQRVCFGSDLPLSALINPAMKQLAIALHRPLLERLQKEKG